MKGLKNTNNILLEFTQSETNQIFLVGNTIIFYVKSGDVIHPIKLAIIDNPMGDKEDNIEKANLFFAKNISNYPIDAKNTYFMITQPQQDIRDGMFKMVMIGKEGPQGFEMTNKIKFYTFKNIFKVDVRDSNGKLINTYYANEYDKQNDTKLENNVSEKAHDFITVLSTLKTGDKLKLILYDKSDIGLDYIDTKGDVIQFEIDKTSDLSISYQSLLTSSLIELSSKEDDIISNNEKQIINIKGKVYNNVNGNFIPKDLEINGIEDWEIDIVKTIDNNNNEEDNNSEDDLSQEAKDMMKDILNDPLMKKAFYSQPTLWNIIVATIKGKNPRGTGIAPAKDIISQWGESKQIKAIGEGAENFKREKWARFKVLNKEIVINATGQPQDELKLIPNEEYQALVLKKELGNDDPLTLINKKRGYKIHILKPYKDIPDAFEVSIIKSIESKTGQVKDYKKSGVLQFISANGSGYSKKETNKPNSEPIQSIPNK